MGTTARRVEYELTEVQAAGVYIAPERFVWPENAPEFVLRVKADEFAKKRFEAYTTSVGVGHRVLTVAVRKAGTRDVVKVFRFRASVTVRPELVG